MTPVLLLLLLCHHLPQDFNCDGAKQIGKVNNACNLLCQCAAALDKSLVGDKKKSETDRCLKQCGDCSKAAETCKPGSGLPSACQEGQQNQYVKQCINTYLKSTQGQRSG